ncbi:CLUMA_CG018789, isoform A [Clunio marinus]|uniref:Gustatory receptor n=1 Tax=Clunio marinus TaxID=568069 RepID=A0A1J1J099_9DIPT|nr:CLUMA_CG018789, isoform A [Clunio marinus]
MMTEVTKMFSSNTEHIYDVAKPMHICSQLLGLTSFKVVKKNKVIVDSVTVFNVLILILSTFLYIFAIFLFCTNYIAGWKVKQVITSKIFECTIWWVAVCYFVTHIIMNWWFLFSRKHFINIFNKLNAVDENLSDLDVELKTTRHRNVIFWVSLITSTYFVLTTTLGYVASTNQDTLRIGIAIYVIFFSVIYRNFFLNYHFIFIMWGIKIRYQKINSLMKEFLGHLNPSQNVEKGDEILNQIAKIHDKLVDVSEHINRTYGFPMLMGTATNFSYLTVGIFGIIRLLLHKTDQAAHAIIHIVWMLFFSALIFANFYFGHVTNKEARKTANLLHKIGNKEFAIVSLTSVTKFSQQLMHRMPVFSCGLFPFDGALAFKIVGAISLYLVILFQFENTEQK